MLTKIAVYYSETKKTELLDWEAIPTSTPGLCITQDTINKGLYCLTHIPTGYSVGPRVKSIKRAKEIARGLKELDWSSNITGEHRALLLKTLEKR